MAARKRSGVPIGVRLSPKFRPKILQEGDPVCSPVCGIIIEEFNPSCVPI